MPIAGFTRLRLFLTCWMIFSLHFATNIVREHYPALTIVEHGTFKVDEYAGFHADIFVHRDGHHYIGNQVAGSVIAAAPIFVLHPVLSALEDYGRKRVADTGGAPAEYETKHPLRREFYQKVHERGLDLKFGAMAAATSVLLMAPLSALLVLLLHGALLRRGVPPGRTLWLSLLFAFGTPVFYRAAVLNHNLFLTLTVLGSALLLWRPDGQPPLAASRRFWAGFLAGACLALDYAGLVPLMFLFAYLLWTHRVHGGVRGALRAAPAFLTGTVPPVLFLLWSQWVSYGDPFLPGQYWMPVQNIYVNEGARGFTLPDVELFFLDLFDLDWGLYAFGPVLLLGLIPVWRRGDQELVLPRRERVFVASFVFVFMVFCACNQYSRLQWNSGFRYLLPLVPFAFLQASDHLVRMPTAALALVTAPVVLHEWVLCMVRWTPHGRGDVQAVPESWRRVLDEGVQFPWLNVLKSTSSIRQPVLHAAWLPYALLLALAVAVLLVWRVRRRTSA